MSVQFNLPLREIEALAKPKRIIWPDKVAKPQLLEGVEQQVPPTPHPAPPVWHTVTKIFVLSTGNEPPGSVSELEGFIRFDTCCTPSTKNFSINLPEETSFINENGGLGKLVASSFRDTVFTPANITAFLAEDDNFNRKQVIVETTIDWTNPANLVFMNGQPFFFLAQMPDTAPTFCFRSRSCPEGVEAGVSCVEVVCFSSHRLSQIKVVSLFPSVENASPEACLELALTYAEHFSAECCMQRDLRIGSLRVKSGDLRYLKLEHSFM